MLSLISPEPILACSSSTSVYGNGSEIPYNFFFGCLTDRTRVVSSRGPSASRRGKHLAEDRDILRFLTMHMGDGEDTILMQLVCFEDGKYQLEDHAMIIPTR